MDIQICNIIGNQVQIIRYLYFANKKMHKHYLKCLCIDLMSLITEDNMIKKVSFI